MPLQPGQTLSHYRIERKIGQGGMGEVWSAMDTRLNRAAAIKALPASLAGDPERLARFKREAQLLASLNHPNIAGIYGLEQEGDSSYLAMELVEGDDLSERIEARPLPLEEALDIAGQIAAALEEAHDKGIVHRDLKPANIKVTPDGKVKVLDFGLAKALTGDQGTSGALTELSLSPTMTAAMGTQAGVILGTAAYMSPEQARGKPVDRRADIWAFGVVLFEMLTGGGLYRGETATDIIAAVVTREPDWDSLPAGTPGNVRRVLRRCLQKDPRRRLRDIGDARLELTEEPEDEPTAPVPPSRTSGSRTWLLGIAGLLAGLAAAFAFTALFSREPAPRALWSGLPAPEGLEYNFGRFLEISPDGMHVAFVAPAPDGSADDLLWVRDLDSETARPLSGTEDAAQPFWSPDSQFIGYFSNLKLRKIPVSGGVSTTLCAAGREPRGGSWGADGTILFVPGWSQPVHRVPDAGGSPEPVTQLEPSRLELSHRWPHLLPDGNHFLYYLVSTYPKLNPENPSEADQSGIYISSLDGVPPRRVHSSRSRTVYVDGRLLFVDDGILVAQPFDLDSLTLQGAAMPLAERVTQSVSALWGGALFSVADQGSLIFARGASEDRGLSRPVRRDREGNELATHGEVAPYMGHQLSHDGGRLAVAIGDPADLWILGLEEATSTRFTFDPGNDVSPLWSPDDSRIIFQSSRMIPGEGFKVTNLMTRATSGLGAVELLISPDFLMFPVDWSPDGRFVSLVGLNPGTGTDIMIYSFESGSIEPFLQTRHNETEPYFSPDGRWLAYQSDESGRAEIYVQPFPSPGGKWQVSSNGGASPHWRSDGKELFYLEDDGTLMVIPIETGETFRSGTPVQLFPTKNVLMFGSVQSVFGIAPDGQSFLFLEVTDEPDRTNVGVTLVQNWPALLR